MAKNENNRASDLAKQGPQALSSASSGRAPGTTAESKLGDTAIWRGNGPVTLPPRFGRYRVQKKLGGGGMGTVYLVENTELEREEALKVPHFTDGDDEHQRERFLREAKSAAKLDHANLCPIYDVGVLDGVYYLTMRFLKGKLLSDYTSNVQPARKAVEIVTKLAQALEAAHNKGVIHRDLKPSNIMMVTGVGPVVMDFGLAKRISQADKTLTQEGSTLGTPAYMPPEQVNGELERMGPASDVYSLGVILFQLLTGRLPFQGTMAAIFGQILYAEPASPSALVPELNPALDGICRKAMAKEPSDRYPSMKAFAAVLMDYLRSTPATQGAGKLVSSGDDNSAIFQFPTIAPGPLPEHVNAATPPSPERPWNHPPPLLPRSRPKSRSKNRDELPLPEEESGAKRSFWSRLPVGPVVVLALLTIAIGLWAVNVIRVHTADAILNPPAAPPQITQMPPQVAPETPAPVVPVVDAPQQITARKSEPANDHPVEKFDESAPTDTVTPSSTTAVSPISSEEGSRAGEERDDNALNLKLCWCPAGTTQGFWMGKYEVTQSEWASLMGSMPSHALENGKGDRHPIYYVSLDDATKFCRKLTDLERNAGRLPAAWAYRLPTEAQWEYACRAGTKTATAFGDKLSSRQANFNGDWPHNGAPKGPSLAKSVKVGSYRPNAWGIYDMHGNVKEFTTTPGRVRGGSWLDSGRNCCSEVFIPDPPNACESVGFRVARVPSER